MRKTAITAFLLACFYTLLSFSLLYTTYKRYDLNTFTWDSRQYMAISESITQNDVKAPWKYRILTPFLVRQVAKVAPFYGTEITADITQDEKQLMYYFMLTNYAFVIATAVLLYFYLRDRFSLSEGYSALGGVLFLTSFSTTVHAIVPFVDAGLYFFVMALLLLWHKKRLLSYILVAILSIFQKETAIITVGIILGLEWLFYSEDKKGESKWGLALVPAVLVYVWLRSLMPEVDVNDYNVFGIFHYLLDMNRYTASFFMQSFLPHLPFLAAVAVHVGLHVKGNSLSFPKGLLWTFPILYAIPFFLQVDIGRIVFYGFPVFIAYELVVLKALMANVK